MSGRPWWASEPGEDDGVGPHDPHDPGGRGPGGAGDVPPHRHRADAPHDVCQVCPICAVLRTVDDVRPELIAHLSEAARHLTMAAKAFIDEQAAGYGDDEGLQRIDLDE